MSDDDNAEVVELAGRVRPRKGPDPALDTELGVVTTMPGGDWASWAGIGLSKDGKTVPNTSLLSLDQLTEMLKKDGQARALLRLMTLPILATLKEAEWIAPEGSDGAEQEVEFANLMFSLPPNMGGMSTPLSKIMRQVLRGVGLGFSAFEEVRHIPEDGPLKGKITLKKLSYRDPRTVKFMVDDEGGFDGIRQVANINGKSVDVEIPKDKCWYWAANEEENPFYGVSYFESAYFHYDVKRKLYYISHLAAQFAAVPGRMGKTPLNPDVNQLRAFKRALADFSFNTAMTMPENYDVVPFNGNSGFGFLELIDHHNHMMAKSILAGFADSEDRQVLIDNGGGDASADMFVMALESVIDEIAQSWTYYLMPKYIDWNFNTKVYPVFKLGNLADSAKDAIKETFLAVVGLGQINATPEFVRETEKKLAARLGLDVDYDEIEKMEKAQAEAQAKADAEAEKAQMEMMADPEGMGGPPGFGGPPGPPNPMEVAASETSGAYLSLSRLADELERRTKEREEEDVD